MTMRLRNYDISRVLDRDKGRGAGVGKYRARIFKRLWSSGIDSKGKNSASLCSLAGRYDNPIPLFKNSSSGSYISLVLLVRGWNWRHNSIVECRWSEMEWASTPPSANWAENTIMSECTQEKKWPCLVYIICSLWLQPSAVHVKKPGVKQLV
jgi:hypothetical protein